MRLDVYVEIEGEDKPALIAEWLSLHVVAEHVETGIERPLSAARASAVVSLTTRPACTEPAPRKHRRHSGPPPAQAAPEARSPIDAAAERAAATIGGEQLRAVVAEIADDRYGGRSPGYCWRHAERALFSQRSSSGSASSQRRRRRRMGAARWSSSVSQPHAAADLALQPRPAEAIDLALGQDFVAASGVQAERAELARRRARLRGLRHPSARVRLGRFQRRRRSGKVLVVLNNDPDWDPALFAGDDAPLLRPLDLQVRERGAARRGGRDHHSHDAVGGLSVAGRAVVMERDRSSSCRPTASRAAGRKRWVTEDAARRLLGPGRISTSLIEQAKTPRLHARAARHHARRSRCAIR